MNEGPDSRPTPTTRRKAYRRPRLVRLGTLTELTAQVGTTSQKSDGHGTKTA
jgi:hypothetical protein